MRVTPFLLTLAAMAATVATPWATDNQPSVGTIARLFEKWNTTLQIGTPEDVAKLYAEDGILLPTVSNDVRENREEIADYFVHFQQLSSKGTIDEEHIRILDENTAINSGIYTFDIIKDGMPQKVQARYTFVYEKTGNDWLIKDHHSSKMPETAVVHHAEAAHEDEKPKHDKVAQKEKAKDAHKTESVKPKDVVAAKKKPAPVHHD